jgi:hypothetical protein
VKSKASMDVRIPTRAMIPNAMISKVRTALRELPLTDWIAWDRFSLNCIIGSWPYKS